jgi:hypothetical protein
MGTTIRIMSPRTRNQRIKKEVNTSASELVKDPDFVELANYHIQLNGWTNITNVKELLHYDKFLDSGSFIDTTDLWIKLISEWNKQKTRLKNLRNLGI